ncbi:MAG: FRG domain-containing protein, partial [Gemmatimonadota bacterium]
ARNSDWKWLSLAQHHGLPTRLLDWTFSPFVAMHFATNELDKMDKDGVIWMVNFDRARAYLPGFFRQSLANHYALTFSVEMLEEDDALLDPFVFERTEGAQDPFVMFFEPPSLDPRIINQWGLFSFTNRLDVRLDEWLLERAKSDPELMRKIIISASAKWEIRDKLDNMNLTERVLMPGLDGLSTWLKRWYSPKSAHPVAASPGPTQATPALPAEPPQGSLVGKQARKAKVAKPAKRTKTAKTAKTAMKRPTSKRATRTTTATKPARGVKRGTSARTGRARS